MKAGLSAAVAGAVAAALAAWVAYDLAAARQTFVLLAPLGCAVVLLAG